ncbi:histidine--tRNA ligase [Dissulfurirhabdus thermomarina]|uniref:Histidine--tRNA ligase n=1 Tax=Dissulfurirhabdus thermomarina TaxID=1765737 RepID=A0A6N9TLW5_DISTH|nr:histidine--tRNA ligase [Dissulfurirhabdus thermomarina]NDY42028.1 histidine--tRNA ligase [Dissulfurirhabdus thermomarina]NMX23053.1 histidine--tRNA ligase [Dissulfurirhabdus thermomarina]
MAITAVRGFKDLLPGETEHWQRLEAAARRVFRSFGFREIRLPVLEKTELFARSIGAHTDIVEKEMYTFTDRSGDSLTLRPEATAGILRAVVEHKLHGSGATLKFFTIGPMFRHERPQKGRLRQFHQMNVEMVGAAEPLADVEVMAAAWEVLAAAGVAAADVQLQVNSLGCPACRPRHREDLLLYLQGVEDRLCDDCRRRARENPLRVFDCKQEGCRAAMQRAPLIKHSLCPACADHQGRVHDALEAMGIPYVANPYLVRGLDYYMRTTFEIVSPRLGAQSAVAAGGRYDGLVAALGGPDLPGVGMAVGMERLLLLLDAGPEGPACDVFVAALGEEARLASLPWMQAWRRAALRVETAYGDLSLKAQLRHAHRAGARLALIVGERELEEGRLILRDMASGDQREIPLPEVEAAVAAAAR